MSKIIATIGAVLLLGVVPIQADWWGADLRQLVPANGRGVTEIASEIPDWEVAPTKFYTPTNFSHYPPMQQRAMIAEERLKRTIVESAQLKLALEERITSLEQQLLRVRQQLLIRETALSNILVSIADKNSFQSKVFMVVLFIVGFGLVLSFYFLPSIVAYVRKHYQWKALFVANILLGWTGIFWTLLLIWSFFENVYNSLRAEPIRIHISNKISNKE